MTTAFQDFPGGIALERNVNLLELAFEFAGTGGVTNQVSEVFITGACRANATNRTVTEPRCNTRGGRCPRP